MTKSEKYQIDDRLGAVLVKFFNSLPAGTKYADLAKMITSEVFAMFRMFYRMRDDGKKRSPNQTDRLVRNWFSTVASMDEKERVGFLELQDDEEE
ncbi:MAG: hypothetical protein IJT12_09680 [Paludibacteraceae bacterium]|nr:hypothetical protein [Paludibacteraceae bacterium]